jgi:hypothetical protein
MEETLRQKQLFLRENILDKGYSTDDFMDLLHSKKGEEGLDLNNWTMRELSLVVKEFISYENPMENPDNIKPSPETDEDYEQNCFQKYKRRYPHEIHQGKPERPADYPLSRADRYPAARRSRHLRHHHH